MKTRTQELAKNKTSGEIQWESEKEELFQEVSRAQEVMEEKEDMLETKYKSLEDGYRTTVEVQDRRIKTLNEEKRMHEKRSKAEIDQLKTKLGTTSGECQAQVAQNTFLVQTVEEREKLLEQEAEVMREEVQKLQMAFDTREKSYVDETRLYTSNVHQLHDLLENAQERMEEGWDSQKTVSDTLRNQVDTLQGQLDKKDQQNERLKNDVSKAQNAQRKEITKTIVDFKKYLLHMSEIERQTETKFQDFIFEQQENDKTSNQQEVKDANKIDELTEEVGNLRFQI